MQIFIYAQGKLPSTLDQIESTVFQIRFGTQAAI